MKDSCRRGPNHYTSGTNVTLDFVRYGTAHLALGRSDDIGGETMSKIHQDVLIDKPTIFIDDQCIMKDGELLV